MLNENNTTKNWVALDVTNTSPSSEIISLFQLPNDFSTGSASSVSIVGENLNTIAGATVGLQPKLWCPTNNSVYFTRYSTPFDVDIYVYNASTDTLVTTIITGLAAFQQPDDFYYHEPTNFIYATTNTGNVYLKIDPTNNTFTTIASAINPSKFAYEPENNCLYAGGTTGQVEVLNLATNTIINTFANALGTVTNAITLPIKNKIYMADATGKVVSIDTLIDSIFIEIFTGLSAIVLSENSICDKENLIYIYSATITTGVQTLNYVSDSVTNTISTTLAADSVDYFFKENQIFISDINGTRMRVFDCTNQSFIQEVSGGGFSARFSEIIDNNIFNASSITNFKVLDMVSKTYIRNEAYTGGIYILNTETLNKIFSSSSALSVNIFTFTSIPFLVGTSTSVVVESGIGYDSIVAELSNGYYEIDYVNVYANNIDQANQIWEVRNLRPSGYEYSEEQFPEISPTQAQFVVNKVPIHFYPTTPNTLQYKLNGLQNVRLIFHYKKIGLTKNNMPNSKLIDLSISPPLKPIVIISNPIIYLTKF